FTTLTPNLGVAEAAGGRFVVADVPGLVEGAAGGRGLGRAFLRHLKRCRVLCYVVDLSEGDPAETLRILRAELAAYDGSLTTRPALVAGNKTDLPAAGERIADAAAAAEPASFHSVSALTGEGVGDLADALAAAVEHERAARVDAEEEHVVFRLRPESSRVEIRRENGAYRVLSASAERLIARFDLTNLDAVRFVQERLVSIGVEDALERAGAREGDEVRIGEQAFEFTPERTS
ncbi:MAG: Obg family GTPase CgtA, partial [Actinomycetota bacterium]